MHGLFVVAHLAAVFTYPLLLILSIPLHIACAIKLWDFFRKQAIWIFRNGPDGWVIFVMTDENNPPEIGETVVVTRKDETESYEKVAEIIKYTETRRFGGGWLCKYEGWEEA